MKRRPFLVAGAAALATAPPVRGRAAAALRVAGSLTEPFMLPYYATDLGTFARAGLDVELTTLATVASGLEAVASNNADVGLADVMQLANAITRGGLPLAIFAGGGIYSVTEAPSLGLAVAKASPYRSARDLEGQTIGVITLNSIMAIAVQEWLRKNGADLSKIKLIEMVFPQMPAAIGKGTIAAAFMGEPFLSFSSVDLRVLARPYDAIAPQFYFGCWFASKAWLATNAALARRFTAAAYDTGRWLNAHPKESAVMLAAHTKLDLGQLQKKQRVAWATSLDSQNMQPILDVAYRYKMLASPVAARDLIAGV